MKPHTYSRAAAILVLISGMTIKTGADPGDSLWSHTYGGNNTDWVNSIIPCSDGGFLLAGFTWSLGAGNSDMWLVKVDAEGNSLWSHTYGGSSYDFAESIIPSGDGGILLAGSTASFGAGELDIWLVKVDAEGDSLWSRTYGRSSHDLVKSIIPSGDGGFLLAGCTWSFGAVYEDMWLLKVDTEGDSLWSHTYGGNNGECANSIIPSGDGGFLLAGYTASFGAGELDMWLVKVDADGDSLWSQTYGDSTSDVALAIIPSGDGGFLLAGWTWSFGAGYEDAWLLKVDAEGDSLWSRTYGGGSYDGAKAIIPSGDGFLLAGRTGSFGAGELDMWLVKVDAQGDSLWSHTYGGKDNEWANAIIPSGDGGFLLAGVTNSFGAGGDDMWLMKVGGPPTAVEPSQPTAPVKFTFPPVHPNPFNPSTVLSFELRFASYVKVEVFDVNGRLVPSGSGTTPTTEEQIWYPSGAHQITFDGSNLPSGIYFAKLTAGEFSQTQKLVLLK